MLTKSQHPVFPANGFEPSQLFNRINRAEGAAGPGYSGESDGSVQTRRKGVLIYIMGPSGAGKDSVMDYAKRRLPPELPVMFAHRYITRPAHLGGGENHVALRFEEFNLRHDNGFFVARWESHGYSYGLGIEVKLWLESGMHVVVNGARRYFRQAAKDFPTLVPVCINVRPDVLRGRLEARGRETPNEINKRLEDALIFSSELMADEPASLRNIDNSNDLDSSGRELLRLLEAVCSG